MPPAGAKLVLLVCLSAFYVSLSAGTTCTPCPAGSSTLYEGQLEGKKITQQNGKCNSCPWGTYSSAQGSETCTPCPSGTSTFASKTGGGLVWGAKSKDSCISEPPAITCPAGQFPVLTTGICKPCPVGTWAGPGCKNNPPAWGEAACCSCPAGQTTIQAGATTALSCGLRPTMSPTAPPTAAQCPLGQEPNPSTDSFIVATKPCTPCDFGSYGRLDKFKSINVCTPCPAGFTTLTNGVTDVNQCIVADCPYGSTMNRGGSNGGSSSSSGGTNQTVSDQQMLYVGLGVGLISLMLTAGLAYHCYHQGMKKKEKEMEEQEMGWDHEQGDYHDYDDDHGEDGEGHYDDDGEGGGGGGGHWDGHSDAGSEAWEKDAAFSKSQKHYPGGGGGVPPQHIKRLSVHPAHNYDQDDAHGINPMYSRRQSSARSSHGPPGSLALTAEQRAEADQVAAAARRMSQKLMGVQGNVNPARKASLLQLSPAIQQAQQVPDEAKTAMAAAAKRMSQAQSPALTAAAAAATRASSSPSPPKRPSLAAGRKLPKDK